LTVMVIVKTHFVKKNSVKKAVVVLVLTTGVEVQGKVNIEYIKHVNE